MSSTAYQWRRAGLLALLAIPVLAAKPATAPAPARSITYPIHAMGTYVNVTLVTSDSAASARDAEAAQQAIRLVDSLMSNWTTTSEVARINRVADSVTTTVQPLVADVIGRSLRIWRGSEHTYDITVEPLVRAWGFIGGPRRVPSDSEARAAWALVGAGDVAFDSAAGTIHFKRRGMRIDLGGIAKGYAVDQAMNVLRARGVKNALVDASGNMMSLGTPPGSEHWRIGLRDPRDRVPYFARMWLDGDAISTSAQYEQWVAKDGKRYGHIIDPRTGQPASGLLAVTVVAPDATTSDSWDTPLYVLGLEAAKAKALERADVAAILVEPGAAAEGGSGRDTVWVESVLRPRFALEPDAERFFVVRYF
jgi:thiamine biosynthesis lipoprotein